MSETDSMVSIQHLSKSFGDTEVLKDVNIEVKKGNVVVVLGQVYDAALHQPA